MTPHAIEPWLRGTHQQYPPVVRALLHSFDQVREDLARWTGDLTDEQVWARPHGLAPVGFHLRHIAGSVDRLFTYAEGRQLSEEQMAGLKAEPEPGMPRAALLAAVDGVFGRVAARLAGLDPATFDEPRFIGRKRLPTTLAGLLIHIAEHTQRHAGQAIMTAKLVRGTPPDVL